MNKMYYRRIPKWKYQLGNKFSYDTGIEVETAIVTRFITLERNGMIHLDSGYACDGPSGITIDTKSFMRGAFVHDAFYQLMRLGLLPYSYRIKADRLLKKMCIEDGMYKWRANYVYFFVRTCAGFAAKPKKEHQKIYSAP